MKSLKLVPSIEKQLKSVQSIEKGLTDSNKARIQPIINKLNENERILEANLGPWNQGVKKFLDSLTPEQLAAYQAQIMAAFT